jgi:hypothetical protein
MPNKDNTPENIPEFSLEDIMKEFGAETDPEVSAESLGDTQVYPPVTPEILNQAAAENPAPEAAGEAAPEGFCKVPTAYWNLRLNNSTLSNEFLATY